MLDEAKRPFLLSLGERHAWNGLEIERVPTMSTNWRYVVMDGDVSYNVNVHDPPSGRYSIMVQGRWKHAIRSGFYTREEILNAACAEDALVVALERVQEMSRRRRENS